MHGQLNVRLQRLISRYSLRKYGIVKFLLMSLRSQVSVGAKGAPSLVLAISGGSDVETHNLITRTSTWRFHTPDITFTRTQII